MHFRVFPCPYHLSRGRHSMFLRPGHLRSSLYPKRQRRLLYWVKFIYTAGVSLSCDMVVKRGPSERLSLMFNHSSINAFFKASLIGIFFFFFFWSSVSLYLFSGGIKCWCGTIAAKLSLTLQRDSHDRCRFSLVDVPSRKRRQLHVVRAI